MFGLFQFLGLLVSYFIIMIQFRQTDVSAADDKTCDCASLLANVSLLVCGRNFTN